MVASQGASPSGRFMAVAGRGSRPERDLGRWIGEDRGRGEAMVGAMARGF